MLDEQEFDGRHLRRRRSNRLGALRLGSGRRRGLVRCQRRQLSEALWRAASLRNSSNNRFRSETLRSIGAAVRAFRTYLVWACPDALDARTLSSDDDARHRAAGARAHAHDRVAWRGTEVVASQNGVGRPGSRRCLDQRQQLLDPAGTARRRRRQGVPRRSGPRERAARRAPRIAAVADGGLVGAGASHWYENLAARSRRSSLIIDPPDGRLPSLTAEARQRAAATAATRRGPRRVRLLDRPQPLGSLHHRWPAEP